MNVQRFCSKHEDVPYIVRSSGSVLGGSIGWGCAVCNMLEVERLRAYILGKDIDPAQRETLIDQLREGDRVLSAAAPVTYNDHVMALAADEIEKLRTALIHIGEQACEGMFTEHGDCPATYACSAIITELIDLGMPPKGVEPVPPSETNQEGA